MWTHKDPSNFTPRGLPFYTTIHHHHHHQHHRTPPCSTTHHHRRFPASENKWRPPLSNNNIFSNDNVKNPNIHNLPSDDSPYGRAKHVELVDKNPPLSNNNSNNNNVNPSIHNLPPDDSPYGRAKHVELVDKNPSKAVAMFWAAINLGDRVDSALKDMTVAMKQLGRSEEAIEAINSFRHLCSVEAQESLDNIMLELYKRSERIEDQIQSLESRIKQIEDATTQNGSMKIQNTSGQEYSRLLGNLGWAYLQKDKYKQAEEIYRRALSLEPDKNKQCNLAICLMYMKRMTEAKFLLSKVKDTNRSREKYESYARSYECAIQVMHELESCKSQITEFSSFLSRNKATDSDEKGTNGNRESMQKPYVSPCPSRGVLRTPFTQPRVRDKVGLDGGYFQKLQFELPVEDNEKSGGIPLMKESGTCKKKSWADIADEEEEYGDENEDWYNIIDEKIGSSDVQNGCHTVKRSLEFQDIHCSSESRD